MRALGCDIGNAFAYVSILNAETGLPESTLPPQWAGGSGMPTEAYVCEDGSIDVGSIGSVAHRDPSRVVRAVKRALAKKSIRLGEPDGSERVVDARDVYTAVARRALEASAQTMAARGIAPTRNVVLTYPASFGDARQLISSMHAAVSRIPSPDGLHYVVVGSIPEPAAIALDFLHFMRHEVVPGRRIATRDVNVVVYDLGHGTFDTALVTARAVMPGNVERPWDIHDYDGLGDVGGIDFDEALIGLFRERLGSAATEGDPYMDDQLRDCAVRCKHELTESERARVGLFLPDGTPVRLDVTRREFEAATEHLIDRTVEKLSSMFESARKLGVPVTHVVLSGGASRMPMVRRKVEELVGDGVLVSLFRPSEAVSFGAARFANTLVDLPQNPVHTNGGGATAEQLMDQLFGPLLEPSEPPEPPEPPIPPEPPVPPAPAPILHVPHPLGILYPGRRGRMMQTLLPKGAVGTSDPGQMGLRADDTSVELVVARAIDAHTDRHRLGEGHFREVCHLVCEQAVPGTSYDVRICLEQDGTVSGRLVDASGNELRMEMI